MTQVQHDAPLTKRLWLRIARHVVASAADGGEGAVAGVLALLNEPGTTLRLEEVLPLFPAFTRIDHFQPAVCAALAASSEQVRPSLIPNRMMLRRNDATELCSC